MSDIVFAKKIQGLEADSLLDMIQYWKDKTGNCICGITTTKYVREASKEDIENFKHGWYI